MCEKFSNVKSWSFFSGETYKVLWKYLSCCYGLRIESAKSTVFEYGFTLMKWSSKEFFLVLFFDRF